MPSVFQSSASRLLVSRHQPRRTNGGNVCRAPAPPGLQHPGLPGGLVSRRPMSSNTTYIPVECVRFARGNFAPPVHFPSIFVNLCISDEMSLLDEKTYLYHLKCHSLFKVEEASISCFCLFINAEAFFGPSLQYFLLLLILPWKLCYFGYSYFY